MTLCVCPRVCVRACVRAWVGSHARMCSLQVTECLLSLPQELEHIGGSDMSPALLAALKAGNLPHTVDGNVLT